MAEQGRVLPGKQRVGPTSARRPKPLEPVGDGIGQYRRSKSYN